MNTEDYKTPKDASEEMEEIIIQNLRKIVALPRYSQHKLVELFAQRGLTVNQGTLSKYVNGTEHVQLSVIVKLCEILEISITDIVSPQFDCDRLYTMSESTKIKQEELLVKYVQLQLGGKFILNPKDRQFQGYMQSYFCYFFPTLSNEDRILEGKMELEDKGAYCGVEFHLKTNKTRNGESVWKHYNGCAIISRAVEACYVILSSADEGEVCMINFRHFFIRHQELDCRMAETLTTGAGERHFPTVHRMLISREEIKPEHIRCILPHMHLNSNTIQIEKEKIESLAAEEYSELIEHLIGKIKPIEVYNMKEDYVVSNAGQFLSKGDARNFLSIVWGNSLGVRYNKVSNKVDENVRGLLLSYGYYGEEGAI